VHVVARHHLRSPDKDGCHAIRSAIAEKPVIHAYFVVLCFTEPELLLIEVYIARIVIFYLFCFCDLDLDPMTFIYELDPYSLHIHRLCTYELPDTSRLSSYRLTDRQKRRFTGGQ